MPVPAHPRDKHVKIQVTENQVTAPCGGRGALSAAPTLMRTEKR